MKDRFDKVEVNIEYCTTHEMLADLFTKPVQGFLFHKFIDIIMRYKHITTLLTGKFSIKKCVGDQKLQILWRKYH